MLIDGSTTFAKCCASSALFAFRLIGYPNGVLPCGVILDFGLRAQFDCCVQCGEGRLNLILYAPSVPLCTPKWGIDHFCRMVDGLKGHVPNVRRPTEEASILWRSRRGGIFFVNTARVSVMYPQSKVQMIGHLTLKLPISLR